MKECVTHHHACDCREAYFKKLEEALKFYASGEHIKNKRPIDSEEEEVKIESDRWDELFSWEYCGDMYSGKFCENGRIAKKVLERE